MSGIFISYRRDDSAAEARRLFDALAARFPDLRELIVAGTLHPSVVANLNGDEFVSDRGQALSDRDHVLILSADVGG